MYFSLNGENAAGKVDVAARKMVGKVAVGRSPVQVFVTPGNKTLLVANQTTKASPNNTVSLIDTAQFTVAATVKTDKGSHGVAIDGTGKFAYVTNAVANSVSVFAVAANTGLLTPASTVPAGSLPNASSVGAKTVNGPSPESVSANPAAVTAATSVLNEPAAIAVSTMLAILRSP